MESAMLAVDDVLRERYDPEADVPVRVLLYDTAGGGVMPEGMRDEDSAEELCTAFEAAGWAVSTDAVLDSRTMVESTYADFSGGGE